VNAFPLECLTGAKYNSVGCLCLHVVGNLGEGGQHIAVPASQTEGKRAEKVGLLLSEFALLPLDSSCSSAPPISTIKSNLPPNACPIQIRLLNKFVQPLHIHPEDGNCIVCQNVG
jgi:hypothetical protein